MMSRLLKRWLYIAGMRTLRVANSRKVIDTVKAAILSLNTSRFNFKYVLDHHGQKVKTKRKKCLANYFYAAQNMYNTHRSIIYKLFKGHDFIRDVNMLCARTVKN